MGRGKLSQKLRRAIELTEDLNPNLMLDGNEVLAVVARGEVQARIYNSTERVKVVVRCEGCCAGRRHHRKATPKTLSKKGALQCRLCMVGACKPQHKDVKMLPAPTECRFIAVLWQLRMDEMFMFQVVPSDPQFWGHCMDFYNYIHGYYVQVDGAYHWTDMHKHSCEKVLDADFKQAWGALAEGATLVRIHEADLHRVDVVHATLAAAQGFVGVVLSPSYASQWVPCQGQKVLYTQALQWAENRLALSTGPTGVISIQKQ